MKSHLRKSAILLIALFLGFFVWNWNLNAKIKLKTESQIKNLYVPMFCYHRITPEVRSLIDLSPEMLESQLQFFKDNGYHPITGLQYIKLQQYPEYIPDKPVVLSFDDGSIGHYQYAFPLLKKYGFQATFFVYPNVVFENTEKMITWSELREMAQGGMDIESHTMSHSFLTKPGADPASPEYLQWLEQELKGSKTLLEQKLNRKISLLGYPYGWFNRVVEAEATRAGYEGAFTVNWGVNRLNESPFRLKRRVVSNNLRPKDFERYLSSRPLSLEIIAPADAALFTEKPVIKFRLVKREVDLLDITVRDDKGVVRADREGIFTFDKYQVKKAGYYQITISGFDDQKNFYQDSWGFDYRPSSGASSPIPTPTIGRLPELSPTPARRMNTLAVNPTPTRRNTPTPSATKLPTATPLLKLTPTPRRSSTLTPSPTRRMNTLTPTAARVTPTPTRWGSTLTPTPTPRRSSMLSPTPTRRTNTTTLTSTPTRRNTPTATSMPAATTTLTPTPRRSSTLSPSPTRGMNNTTPTSRRNTPAATSFPTATTTLTSTPIRRGSILTPTPTPTPRKSSTLSPSPTRMSTLTARVTITPTR